MAGMERLTVRDSRQHAWYNNDGVLIRGANGTFHQKKDMTAHYIHDRFVALDKVIDRLAAYEDTGLTPEEIVALIQPPNDLLTLEELREMGGEPYWHIGLRDDSPPPHWAILPSYVAQRPQDYFYGKHWLAYRRKPEEGMA